MLEGRQERWHREWALVEGRFRSAEMRGDVEEMHRLWPLASTQWLKKTTGVQYKIQYKNAADRAVKAEFVQQSAVAVSNKDTGNATNHQER